MTMLRILSAAVATAAVFAAVPASAEMKTEWVEYSQGGMKLKAYMAYDDKITGKRPAVLVAHAREGMTPKTQQLTELWAKLCYVSFAADIFGYGQGILPKDVPEMTAQTQIYSKDTVLEWIYRYARQARLVDGADEVHKMVLAQHMRAEGRDFWKWGKGEG